MSPHSDERAELDKLIESTSSYDKNKLPQKLLADLGKWKWGSYGWVSPASLIVSAAWVKSVIPVQDCCKIWAHDENGSPIKGGYSLRTKDESLTVPMFAKHDLCKGFCSDNSGMQGSRAIEKMRSLKRLEKNFARNQRTFFDLTLFASILNQVNDLGASQAREVVRWLIVRAKEVREARLKSDALIGNTVASFDVMKFLSSTADPELTKCVAAACLNVLYHPHGLELDGVGDHKTAADARADKPGDLSLRNEKAVVLASEVKAKSISLDWQNITRALKIVAKFPSITSFLFILEERTAAEHALILTMRLSAQLATSDGRKISFVDLRELYALAAVIAGQADMTARTGEHLAEAPSVKPETKKAWLAQAP